MSSSFSYSVITCLTQLADAVGLFRGRQKTVTGLGAGTHGRSTAFHVVQFTYSNRKTIVLVLTSTEGGEKYEVPATVKVKPPSRLAVDSVLVMLVRTML